jgi:polysaccharide chain length determinant protein (PEP-CTERM system associated)
MLGQRELTLEDYAGILRRHWWQILIPVILVGLITYLVSLWLPNKYTSEALVLVEQQSMPDSFVKPVITDELNQRLISLQEQVLSRSQLQPLIQRFDLYNASKSGVPMEELIDTLRESILVTPVRSDIGSPRTNGLPAFRISYEGEDPRLAQQVCSELLNMFLKENLEDRSTKTQATTSFLTEQVAEAKRKLDEQDRLLAEFKSKNLSQLPGNEQANFTMIATLNSRLDAATQAITQAQQQKTYAESMLNQQLAQWKASQNSAQGDPLSLEKQRDDMNMQLAALQARYTDDYPDVVKMKASIAQMNKRIKDARASQESGTPSSTATTSFEPREIQQLRLSVRQADDLIKNKTAEQARIQRQIDGYEARIQVSPIVEEGYKKVTRDYESAQRFYDELLAKSKQSQIASDLERSPQSGGFRVMDPPNLPEKPTSPDRLMITFGGLGGGFALGMVITFLLEMKDKAIRTERDIEAFLKLPTLAMIPTVGNATNGNGRFGFLRRNSNKEAEVEHEKVGV